MLDVHRLTLLATVIDSGSMTAAAQRLSYSPSAVSQQLRKLEAEVGQPLLHRGARGITATEAGVVLAAHARRIDRALSAAQADLAELAGLRRGTLEIGTFPTIASSLLPLAVSRFRAQHPDVALTVRSARLDHLRAMLEDGTVGISLLWDYAWGRIDPADFVLTPLLEDPTALVVGAEHWAAGHREITMGELSDEDWIIRAHDHPVAKVLERACRAAGFTPRIAFHANDYQEAQAMVSIGLGIALAPRTAVINKHPRVRVVSLGSTAPARRILLAHRHERVRAPAELAMHQILVRTTRQYRDRLDAPTG